MARPKLPQGAKKVRLNITVKQSTKDYLFKISQEQGISVSEFLDIAADSMLEKERKAREKAERKAKKEAKEREQLPGQTDINDFL